MEQQLQRCGCILLVLFILLCTIKSLAYSHHLIQSRCR